MANITDEVAIDENENEELERYTNEEIAGFREPERLEDAAIEFSNSTSSNSSRQQQKSICFSNICRILCRMPNRKQQKKQSRRNRMISDARNKKQEVLVHLTFFL